MPQVIGYLTVKSYSCTTGMDGLDNKLPLPEPDEKLPFHLLINADISDVQLTHLLLLLTGVL